MSMTEATKVVHCKVEPYDVLIDRTTIFGNPFKIGRDGTREQVIRKFGQYFYKRIERDLAWKAEVLKLRGGKVLGCWCAPQPCHGAVYADFLDTYDQIEAIKAGASRG